MGRCRTTASRLGILAVVLIASGCVQRTAPIDIPGASPPPRALLPIQPQVYQRPVPIQPRSYTPFPDIGNNDLPPPNPNPMVNDVGTPSMADAAPRLTPRPREREITDNPYAAFDPTESPSRPAQEIAQEPLAAPEDIVPDAADTAFQPRASDDYATLLGEETGPASQANSESATPPRVGPGAAAPVPGGKALVALLVPESDRRGSVRALAGGLAKAASLAAADFNEPLLELRKYDTGGDPRKAAQAAQAAIADGAKLIIGPLFSGSAAAVRPIAQASGVNVIAFTTDNSVLGGGLYSIGFLPETDVQRIVSYSAEQGQRNIALLVPNSPFGGVVTRAAQSSAGRSGASIVRVQSFEEDFRSADVAAKEFAAFYDAAPRVDAIILATSGRTLQGLASFLAFRDVLPNKLKYMGLGVWDDEETFREATLRGGWFPGVDPALKADFAYRYGQAYGGEPPSIALLGYDAVAVAATLVQQGGFSQQALLRPSGFTGMSGLFRFRRDGRNERALSILEVGQGTFRVVDPAASDFSTQVSSLIGG